MYLSYPKVYRTVTLIYQTFLERNRQALDGWDDILDVISLLGSSLCCSRTAS